MKLFVVGGDMRICKMAETLIKDGITVEALGLPPHIPAAQHPAEDTDAIVLGVPVSRQPGVLHAPFYAGEITYDTRLALCRPSIPVFCGKPDAVLCEGFQKAGISYVDYMLCEELAVMNAIPTAEGAVSIALKQMPSSLHGANCLVVGYGRIGKYLSRLLAGCGASVTVSARRPGDIAWIEANGFHAVQTAEIDRHIADKVLVINTVPAPVLGKTALRHLGQNALIIDLASAPGGVDIAAAKLYDIKVIPALSLPGKVAPVTAGAAIARTVTNLLLSTHR